MALSWEVIYKDKSVHKYTEETKIDFNIGHIDNEKLDLIIIKDPKSIVPAFVLHFDDKRKKLIFTHRNELPSGIRPYHIRIWIVGWQIRGTDIQSINYIIETIGRKIKIKHTDGVKREHIQDMFWIESAGKWDRARDARFKSLSEKQLAVVGSRLEK